MFGFVLTDAQDVDPFAYLMLPVFVVIGLYMLVGRFAVDIVARRRTHYMLTDQRAVIESGLFTAHRASVNLAAAAEIQLQGGREPPLFCRRPSMTSLMRSASTIWL